MTILAKSYFLRKLAHYLQYLSIVHIAEVFAPQQILSETVTLPKFLAYVELAQISNIFEKKILQHDKMFRLKAFCGMPVA
jgi:hypothetical protein